MYIPLILGTGRQGRASENAARYVFERIKQYGAFESELIDARDFQRCITQNPKDQDMVDALREKMQRADGYLIVSPEYNHGYPGELKLLLDEFYDEYEKKPVGIMGASDGGMGGVRMVEQLRLVAITLKLVPIQPAVYFSNVDKLFNENGTIKDDSFDKRVDGLLKELTWYADVLARARA
ncbi:MAG: NADPH-dependent FMN reductase [Candidatus Spechtbacterales bacterium]